MRNAIDTQAFAYNETRALRVKADFGWTDKFIIGHVGRFCPQKIMIFSLTSSMYFIVNIQIAY